MSSLETIRDLFAHMRWADTAVWRTVLASPTAREDAKLRDILFHMHHVHRAFLRFWSGQPHERLPDETPALAEVHALGREVHDGLERWFPGLAEERLRETVVVPWSKFLSRSFGRDAGATTLGETLLQLAMHGTYHRGQANMRLRQLGLETRTVDYVVWLWLGRPREEWDGVNAG